VHDPAVKSRFEMILSLKVGELMLIERRLGTVPHTTRETQSRLVAAAAKS
jgi:hypothetical protein